MKNLPYKFYPAVVPYIHLKFKLISIVVFFKLSELRITQINCLRGNESKKKKNHQSINHFQSINFTAHSEFQTYPNHLTKMLTKKNKI